VKAAERAIPGAQASQVTVPGAGGPITIRVHGPGDHLPLGLGTVVVDPGSATPVRVVPRDAQPPGQRMFDWIFPLHVGLLGGTPYRVLMVLIGLAPALLMASGILVWSRRRRNRPNARPAVQ
jgi:uncharacterized iron-regulated membrane protein